MKCAELEKDIQLLLDDEINSPESRILNAHLKDCHSCRQEFANLRQVRELLKVQPAIVPDEAFDNRMLRTIENHRLFQPPAKQSRFASLLTFPRPIFAAALFTVGIGLAFLLGRNSVSQIPQPVADASGKQEVRTVEKLVAADPIEKVVTQTKVITKYIKVPVISEKTVEKKIYFSNSIRPKSNEIADKEKPENVVGKKQSETAKQFNLKDLQPVANVTYQIIKKGENNE